MVCSIPRNITTVIKSKRMRWAKHVACIGARRNPHKILVAKPEGKRELWGIRRRWEDNTKMVIKETGCGGVEWVNLAQARKLEPALVNMIMNFGFGKCGEFLNQTATISFLKWILLHGLHYNYTIIQLKSKSCRPRH